MPGDAYDSVAAAAYDRRWARYTRRSLALLRPLLGDDPPGRLLDVGCGTGGLAERLAGWGVTPARYLGVDRSPAMLAVAATKRSLAGAGWVAADAAALPVRDASWDTVVSASSLHDWTRPAAALREARRALRPGGRLLLLDWCADGIAFRASLCLLRWRGIRVHHAYTRAELGALLASAGFRVDRVVRGRAGPLWPLMAADARAIDPPPLYAS